MITIQEITIYDAYSNPIESLVQWDSDVYIYVNDSEIDEAYGVHFFNVTMDEAYVVTSTYSNGILKAKIPNDLLTQAYAIVGYINITKNGEQKSLYRFRINIIKKPKPSNYIYVDSKDYVNLEEVLSECRDYADSASGSASNASKSASSAAVSANSAADSAKDAGNSANSAADSKAGARDAEVSAKDYAKEAESWAHGSTSTELAASSGENITTDSGENIFVIFRQDEDEDNAKYYAEQARTSASNASGSATAAGKSAINAASSAESANTSKNAAADSATAAKASVTNAKASETNAEKHSAAAKACETNAGKSAEAAQASATAAESSASEAESSSLASKSYAVGGTGTRQGEDEDNAKYYYEQSKKDGTAAQEVIRMIMMTGSVFTILTCDDGSILLTDDGEDIVAVRKLCMGACKS